MPPTAPLLRVCGLLNEAGTKYLICGAQACILHGLVRTTEDVDLLIEPSEANCQRVIDGLARWLMARLGSLHRRTSWKMSWSKWRMKLRSM